MSTDAILYEYIASFSAPFWSMNPELLQPMKRVLRMTNMRPGNVTEMSKGFPFSVPTLMD